MRLLEINDLTVRYGNITAVAGVSLSLDRGGALAILGRNGAGKSTLLNTLSGLIRPASGSMRWEGEDISHLRADRRARNGISLVAEGKRIFANLTVAENLRLGGFSLTRSQLPAAIDQVRTMFPILAARFREPAGQLSGGQQQMLAIGRALMTGPTLLLLDEPSTGLAPKIAAEVYARLADLRASGLTIIVVEQQIDRALRLVDDVVVLNLGRTVLTEQAHAVSRDDPRIQAAYIRDGTAT